MYQAQKALISHLQSAQVNPIAITIKEYAGEVQAGMRQRVDLPAVLVLFQDGNPIAPVPEYNFSLLFCSQTNVHERNEVQTDGLKLTHAYARWLSENEEFSDDDNYYYLTGIENASARTIISDHKYNIIELTITVKVN